MVQFANLVGDELFFETIVALDFPLTSTSAFPEMQVAMLLIAAAVALQSIFVERFCFMRVMSAKFETV
jgi:hypothetical protein